MKRYVSLVVLPLLVVGCVPKSELEKAQSDLAAAQQKISALEQQVAQMKPLAAKARQLPIATKLDKHPVLTGGYNLVIENQSREPLRLAITVEAGGKKKSMSPVIEAHPFSLTGLAPNDVVTLASEGYDPVTLTVK